MIVYCVFCRTTFEEKTVQNINKLYGSAGVKAISPVRILKERCRGVVKEVKKPLIAGYVFVFCSNPLGLGSMKQVQDVIKMLSYPTGEYELRGEDLAYANFIYGNNGVIGISDIMCEGKDVKVLSGPLKEYQGTIIKLDKRKQRVTLRVGLDGIEREISLSVNILEAV